MVKRILTAGLFLFAASALAQPTPFRVPPKYTVATAPACVDGEPKLYAVTDGTSSTDCATGGGSTEVICKCIDGSASAVASGGGGVDDGDKGDITVSGSGATWTIDADSVALGTDTTGNYAGSSSEGGAATSATALAADPADCAANQFANAIAASGALTCAAIADADVPDGITVTLAGTATALAADPADCLANQFANAIAASGALACSALADADIPDGITVTLAGTATALAANGANCSAGQYPLGVDASGAAESCTADDDLPDADEVTESMLKAVDAASDEECLTYETTTGDFEWQTCGSAGIGGSTGATDDAILIADGVGGATLAASAATLTAAGSLVIPSAETIEFSTDFGIARVGAASGKITDGGAGYGGLILKDGSKTAASVSWTGSGVDTGFFSRAANYTMIASDGKEIGYFRWSGNSYDPGLAIVGGIAISGGELDSTGPSVGIYRAADGVARIGTVNDNGTIGKLLSAKLVEANTAGSGSPNVLTAAESGTVYANEGATAANYHTLPTAAAGYVYEFCVQDADGLRIVSGASDTIRVLDKVTAAAGYIESTTIGSCVTLKSLNATEWFATSIHGVWTDGTFTYDDTGNTAP